MRRDLSAAQARLQALTAGSTTYAYDLADRLVSATVGTTTVTYAWSGDGIRRSAATGTGAATTNFLVDRAMGKSQAEQRELDFGYTTLFGRRHRHLGLIDPKTGGSSAVRTSRDDGLGTRGQHLGGCWSSRP